MYQRIGIIIISVIAGIIIAHPLPNWIQEILAAAFISGVYAYILTLMYNVCITLKENDND